MDDLNVNERVRELVGPALAACDLEVVDVDHRAGVLRVTVDRPGGVDLETISTASRIVSDDLDRHDVVPGRYVLEVSSPGVERPLRTPEHFRRFVGSAVAVRTRPGTEGDRRTEGVLESADDTTIVVAGRRLSHDDIERAHTVFVWGPAPKRPTSTKRSTPTRAKAGRS